MARQGAPRILGQYQDLSEAKESGKGDAVMPLPVSTSVEDGEGCEEDVVRDPVSTCRLSPGWLCAQALAARLPLT